MEGTVEAMADSTALEAKVEDTAVAEATRIAVEDATRMSAEDGTIEAQHWLWLAAEHGRFAKRQARVAARKLKLVAVRHGALASPL